MPLNITLVRPGHLFKDYKEGHDCDWIISYFIWQIIISKIKISFNFNKSWHYKYSQLFGSFNSIHIGYNYDPVTNMTTRMYPTNLMASVMIWVPLWRGTPLRYHLSWCPFLLIHLKVTWLPATTLTDSVAGSTISTTGTRYIYISIYKQKISPFFTLKLPCVALETTQTNYNSYWGFKIMRT